MALAHQQQVGVEIDRHHLAPLVVPSSLMLRARRERCRRSGPACRARRTRARRAFERRGDGPLVGHVAVRDRGNRRARAGVSTAGLRSSPTTAAPRARSAATHALPMPEAAPVTNATSPANSGGLPAFLQLRLLEIPVFDVEDVLRRQRLVAAERLGAQDDVHRVLVDLLDDRARPLRVRPSSPSRNRGRAPRAAPDRA